LVNHFAIALLYTLSLHDALPIYALDDFKDRMIYGISTGTLDDGIAAAIESGTPKPTKRIESLHRLQNEGFRTYGMICPSLPQERSEEHTSELQSREKLVCRLLLE